MLKESQRLQYVVTEVQGPSIKAEFTDCKASIQLPMEKVFLSSLKKKKQTHKMLLHYCVESLLLQNAEVVCSEEISSCMQTME